MKALLKCSGALAAAGAVSLAACGGGGSGATPVLSSPPPAPPPATATPTATPAPTPTPVPTLATADYSLQPVFLCVNHPSGSTFYLRFSYRNLNAFDVQVVRGSTDPATGVQLNSMVVASGEGGTSQFTQQPELFLKGDHTADTSAMFEVPVGGESSATWYLAGNQATGSTSGTACSSPGGG